MTVFTELMTQLDAAEPEMIQLRRYLHEHPEVSYHEKETSAYLKKVYHDLGIATTDYGTGYGFVVDIDSGKPGPHLALRADFDALPVQEENDLPFKSQNPGVMHACGHDAHTAYLLVLAKTLFKLKDQLQGTIRILHQPAEEKAPGGAPDMIAGGVLDGIDNVIGIHVMTNMQTGTIGIHPGEAQSGGARFDLTFTGHGGHASMPQLSNDAIVAGSYFVTAVQTILSRRIDPFDMAAVTISSFDGASAAYNAIKQSVALKGDVRLMKESNRQLLHDQVAQIAKGTAATFGVKATLDYLEGAPVLYNDPSLTAEVTTALNNADIPQVTKVFDCGPQNPSEDFAHYAKHLPCTFFYVGAAPQDGKNHPHHSPDFMIDEDSILIAAKAAGAVTLDYLFNHTTSAAH